MFDINIDPTTGSKEVRVSSSVRIYNNLSDIVEVGIKISDKPDKPYESFIKDVMPGNFLHIPLIYVWS
jgi:hypothetical protein